MNNRNQTESAPETPIREGVRSDRTYHEIPGLRPESKDVLQQMDANLRHLEDLTGRLSFVLTEVRSLIRR